MRWILLITSLCVAACSGTPSRVDRTEAREPSPSETPSYELNEWGLISASASGFEVAAGPGQRPLALTIDKPVLYVHPLGEARFTLSVQVDVPEGLEVAEHYPATGTSPLRWRAQVGPHCEGDYPSADDSACPDGYCEVVELPLYETADAACLEVDETRAPLLFYRLRARGESPVLPLAVTRDGDAMVVRNVRLGGVGGGVGGLVRVTFDGTRVAVTRADMPAVGETVRLGRGSEEVEPARAAIRAELLQQGLRESERDAFMRAWDTALFGPGATNDGDGVVADEPADRRIDVLTDDETTVDLPLAGPRWPDALLYWLDDAAIDGFARITADPPPSAVHRAYLVRVAP